MYAAIDNKVTLQMTVDVAAFFSVSRSVRAQVNIDNALNRKYYLTADNNNNITPGAPRTCPGIAHHRVLASARSGRG